MDPLTHIGLTRRLLGTEFTIILAGIAADAPFYLTYPAWVMRQGQLKHALQTHDWPQPPRWMEKAHHAFHSLPLVTIVAMLVKWRTGRFPWRFWGAWALHILVDIPTHSRRQWGRNFCGLVQPSPLMAYPG